MAQNTDLNLKDLKILAYIEQYFYETGNTPTIEQIAERFLITNKETISILAKEKFREQYKTRNLPPLGRMSDEDLLTPNQLLAANILLNEHDRSSVSLKLKNANVTPMQLQVWMRNDKFAEYMRKEAARRFGNADIAARRSLMQLIEDRDLGAIKYYFEVTGMHTSQSEIGNLTSILARLMEILARFLTPEALLAVADEMEQIIDVGYDTKSSERPFSLPVVSNG